MILEEKERRKKIVTGKPINELLVGSRLPVELPASDQLLFSSQGGS
jgi:hypothetical protein